MTYVILCYKLLKVVNLCNHLHNVVYSFMAYSQLMTIEEVADYLRVKKRTVYEWVKKGKIPAIKTVGQWRFKKEKIDAWLDSQ